MSEEIEDTEEVMGDLELSSDGKSKTCTICCHPACNKATEIYYSTGKDIESVFQFFKTHYGKSFSRKNIERHFKEHIEIEARDFALTKETKINELKDKIMKGEKNTTRVAIIKEIIYDFIKDIYAAKPDNLITNENKILHQKLSKQLVDLSKAFREYYQMEFDILGHGKSEEEQKQLMKNYMTNSLKRLFEELEDIPEAQERLNNIIGAIMSEGTSE
jgi:hypothetical protein